jgi:hypothetical protein
MVVRPWWKNISSSSRGFPRKGDCIEYSRDLNFGEFVHFMSGAAGTNLKDQATHALAGPQNVRSNSSRLKRTSQTSAIEPE